MIQDHEKEKNYWTLVESTQRRQYPEFVDQLSNQVGPLAEEGQVAVIEFQGEDKPSIQKFTASRNLRRYLEKDAPSSTALRRVFVLEGLPRKFVQVLGSNLRVPPSFFATHWASHGRYRGSVLNRTPRYFESQRRFLLSFQKLHQVEIKGLHGDEVDPIYHMDSSVRRPLSRVSVFGDLDGPFSSFEQLSYWCTCKGDSWDVVFLVDPPLGNFVTWKKSSIPREVLRNNTIKLNASIEDGLSQAGSWYSTYASGTTLSTITSDLEEAHDSPEMQSSFDDIVLLYREQRRSHQTPASCTDICRRLVLSAWTASIRIMEAQIVQEQFNMSIGARVTEFSSATWLDDAWTTPWESRRFGRLIRAKSALESVSADLYHNMDALGIGGKCQITEEWEADAWKSLQYTTDSLKTRVDIILQAYMQAVSVRETITANTQARQVGYLTSLATLFLPISFIASIFSMGGKFSVGEQLFWVFWAFAIPVVGIGCGLLFSKPGRKLIGKLQQKNAFSSIDGQ
ncbi:hypothetical protein EDB80DRAFT_774496 [Ilyonectria destructans]|nr:hypothetical protein EDB80DRAFT_774496 [Ilyonectria destructans]